MKSSYVLFALIICLAATIDLKESLSVTTDKISILSTELVSQVHMDCRNVTIGAQCLVYSHIVNNQDIPQDFVYIVQIKNSDDIVVSLSWWEDSIKARELRQMAQVFMPDAPGRYTAQAFVWQSITNPIPLTSSIGELKIDVS